MTGAEKDISSPLTSLNGESGGTRDHENNPNKMIDMIVAIQNPFFSEEDICPISGASSASSSIGADLYNLGSMILSVIYQPSKVINTLDAAVKK